MVTGGPVPAERLARMILDDPGLAGELRQAVLDAGGQDGCCSRGVPSRNGRAAAVTRRVLTAYRRPG